MSKQTSAIVSKVWGYAISSRITYQKIIADNYSIGYRNSMINEVGLKAN